MEISIKGDPKEIAALVFAVQERRDQMVQRVVQNPLDAMYQAAQKAIDGIAESAQET